MNKKYIAAIAGTAAVIGTSAIFYSSVADKPAGTDIDDITAISVEVPRVNTATVATVSIETFPVNPAVVKAVSPGQDKISSAQVEKLTSAAELSPEACSVNQVTDGIPRYAEQLNSQKLILIDQRSRNYDPELNKLDSATWEKWRKIYENPSINNYIAEFKPLSCGLKIMSEVRCPQNNEEMMTLSRRLEEYRVKGFNAVLVCFDTTENILQLTAAVDYIRAIGMHTIIAYVGGKESLHAPVFRDPDTIAEFIRKLSVRADAILLGHWRTSVHLFLPDKAYTNYIIKSAREANPDIAVIGQAYWGQTAATGTEEKDFRTTIALPENASAVLIVGLGYPGVATAQNMKRLFAAVVDHPHKIGLVVGESPYFSSSRPTGRNHKFNELVKRQLERQLLKAGCQSTMTFSADGSNRPGSSENLCLEYNIGGSDL